MDNYTKVVEVLTETPELTICEIQEKTSLEPMEIFNILEGTEYGFQFKKSKKDKGIVYSKI